MSSFDANINVIATAISVPDESQLESGVPPVVEIRLDLGLELPFSTGPGQPNVTTHMGSLRFTFPADQAVEFFEKGLDAAQKLPSSTPSKLTIASDIRNVEKAAQEMDKLTKRNG